MLIKSLYWCSLRAFFGNRVIHTSPILKPYSSPNISTSLYSFLFLSYNFARKLVTYLPLKQQIVFMVKSTIASPYFNPPFRPSGFTPLALLNCLRSFLINVPILPVLEDEKIIDLAPWPSYFDDAGRLHFSSANRCHRPEADRMISQAPREIDLIVLATGYKQAFPFLPQSSSLDKINCNDADSDEFDNYPIPATCDVRGIWSSSFGPSVAFIGFIRPTIGAIPPLSELQAMLWLHKLFLSYFPPPCRTSPSGVVVPPYELSFSLQPRGGRDLWRSHRGVDGEAYAYQLALDMGAAPTFSYLTHTYNWKVVWTYLMGPNFGTKFRLVGPWAAFGGSNSDSSADIATPSDYNTNNSYSLPSSVATEDPEAIMQGELFDITSRTGGIFFFITYTIIPLLGFGILSAVVVLAQGLSGWIHNIRCVVRRVYGRWTEKIFSFGGNE